MLYNLFNRPVLNELSCVCRISRCCCSENDVRLQRKWKHVAPLKPNEKPYNGRSPRVADHFRSGERSTPRNANNRTSLCSAICYICTTTYFNIGVNILTTSQNCQHKETTRPRSALWISPFSSSGDPRGCHNRRRGGHYHIPPSLTRSPPNELRN